MNNIVIATHLRGAAAAVEQLTAAGSKVLGYYCNGRRPVLLIDQAPAFVRGSLRRRAPDGQGGTHRVCAAPFHGVQIEWSQHQPALAEVARG